MVSGKLPSSVALALFAFSGAAALAGVHTWDVNEVFTNASGTIQFIELREAGGGAGETGVPGQVVSSQQSTFTIPGPALTPPTTFKHLLFATAAFAALPGAPTPNYIIPANFFSTSLGNQIKFAVYDTMTYAAGILPTNGLNSLHDQTAAPGYFVAVNSPCNYAGTCGSVNAAVLPAAIPDGDGSSTPMTVRRLDVTGSNLRIFWDTVSCSPSGSTQIIYGEGSDLPSGLGGTFGLLGSVCSVSATSPYAWTSVPVATDGSGLLWWLMTIRDASGREGSWGHDSTGTERVGPGPGGSSGQCGVTSKDLTNVCGQ